MRDYSDIVNKAKKKKREEEETKSSSSSNFYDATSIVEKTQLGKRINFETLESDLFDLGTTIGNIYGGWQTQETMANTRSAIESMNQRLGYYQTYQSKYGGTDMTEVANGYKSVLDDWDNLSSTYGYYQDADAFNKARTKAVLDKQFSGLSYDEVQKQLGQYKEGSDEYEYLKKYTNYTDIKEFDKAIEAEKYITDVSKIVGNLEVKEADREAVEKTITANKAKMKNKDADKGYINALETAKRQHALDHKFDLYKDYLDAEDFDEMSQYKNTAKRDGVWAAIGMNGEDETYEYINDVDGARQRIIGKYKDSNAPIDLETRGYEYMTDEEKAVYNYKYEKEGKKSADAYLKDLEVSLSKRLYEKSTEKWEEWSDDGFLQSVGLSTATPILNIAGSIGGAIDTVGEFVKGEEYNPYSALRMASNATSDIRQYVGENIAEETEGMELFGQNIPQFLYQTGMSIADTAVGSQMFGAGFSAVMGMSSAQQRAKELKEAGASSAEIARGAVASGVFEMVFEKLSLDNLIKVKGADSIGKIVTETLKQAGIEASEEIATEVSNILFDTISRGKNSDAYKMYEELLERGFSKSEAGWKLAAELGGQVAWAGIGGALSGTAMGNVSSASDYVQNRRAGNQIIANDRVAEMFDTSKLTPEESEAYKLYDAYAKKGVNPETASNVQVGNLYRQTQSEAAQTLKSRKSTAEQKADAVKTLDNLNTVETSKPEEERARQQRVKDLAKSETTMVNGETAKIEGIKVEDGVTTLLTSRGEAKAEDMTFSTNDAEIVSHAEIMGNDKGNLFWSQYDGKADVVDYVDSFNTAYNYGRLGFDPETALKNRGVLTEAQASEIYKSAIRIEADARQKAIDDINTKYSGGVTVAGKFDDSIIDYDNGTADNSRVNWSDLSSAQRNAITFAKGFSKATGVNIKFIKSKVVDGEHKGANGIYRADKNTIEIDVYAGRMDAKALNDSIIPTLSHEMTHWMKAKSPAMYAKMRAHIGETLALEGTSLEARIDAEIARMSDVHPGTDVTADMAVDEIVARACEDMLSNSEKARELLSGLSESEQKSFIDKVKETFQNLMKWVNDLLNQYKSTSKEAEILRQYESRLKELSKMWDKALEESIKTNQSLQKEGKTAEAVINQTLETIGLHYDAKSETVFSYRSLEDAFHMENAEDFIKTKNEYIDALMKATKKSRKDCENYLNSLFLVHDMIGDDRDRLDYEAAVNKSAWVSNSEYGGSIDFSTLCAKRRLFTGTMDAIIEQLPNTVLTDTDFLEIRNRLLAKELEAPCSMCYVEGSRAKNAIYINNWLTEYKKTNPKWSPQLADFTSTVRLEQTRLKHPEAYEKYKEAMNKLAQRKPKEASVRTDYKGEIRVAFADGTSVDIKNKNGGIRFNSFSDFEIIHALDCMQVVTDMATVGLAGQGYTKVKEFAECFGNTGMKINLSLVAKDVDADGNLIFDEVNGMKYDEAISLRNRYPKNVGTVIVAFNHKQLKAALRDSTIDYVLPFHRSQWRKAQYVLMGLPTEVRDYTMDQNDRITNPKTKKPVKLAKLKHVSTYTNDITGETFEITDNIMPNQYWDYNADGVTNARRYLSYINSNKMTPKFAFLLEKDAEGNWVLPTDADGNVTAEGKGYFKVLIDFKMYDNDGVGSPQTPVVPDFNMPYINDMLKNYMGGHESFPVAHDVAEQFVADYKKNHPKEQYSDRDYSYNALISKPDMHMTELDSSVSTKRSDIVDGAIRNVGEVGFTNEKGETFVHVADMGVDVRVSRQSIIHGLDRRSAKLAPSMYKIGEILRDSIRINEMTPKLETAKDAYVLVGCAKEGTDLHVVCFVVNRFTNEVEDLHLLYSANAKKESAALLPKSAKYIAPPTDSTISISQLLEVVKDHFPQVLPEDVLRRYGYDRRPDGALGDSILYSDRITKAEANQLAREKVASYKDQIERKAKIESITQKALVLNKWMLNNSKDEHIPDAMKPAVAHLLKAIDFSSKRLLNGGNPTKADVSLSQALADVQKMVSKAEVDGDILFELYGSDMMTEMEVLVEAVNLYMRNYGDNEYVLNRMNLEQLKTLDKLVSTIKTSVSQMNQFHVVNSKKGVAHAAQQTIRHCEEVGQAKIHKSKFLNNVDKMLLWGNRTPYYAFRQFGESGQLVFEALQDGWDKFAFHIRKIKDYAKETYNEKEVKEWSEEVKEFDILLPATKEELADPSFKGNKQKVHLTTAQIMSLYCLQKRDQAVGHIKGGGIRITNIKTKKGVIAQNESVLLTEKELAKIISTLGKREIEVADKLQKFMNEDCTAWGNEISMKRFGYKAFGEENYFPIKSDADVTNSDEVKEREKTLYRLLNMSFTKSLTQNANNRIVVDNIFDVFAQHTSEMAKYNALALPVLDAVRWFNYKEKGEKVDTHFKTHSVKASIENAFGKDAKSYINTFLQDINGAENVSRDSLGSGFMTNAKIASVGLNAKVVALQPTSYLRASAVIDNKYLAKGMTHKPNYKMAEKWCGMAQWKAFGFIDINVQRGVADQIKNDRSNKDKASDFAMKGAELADQMTMGYLWNACEAEIRDKRKDLNVGTDEYYTAVGKRLRDVIYATQVVDSTMTRSQMMRSPDKWDKVLTNFASEPTLSYNMLLDVYSDYKLTERKSGKKAAFNKCGKKFARTMYAYTITNALTALLELGFEIFRDDEEKDSEEVMKMYLENLALNQSIINKIPYAKEMISLLQGFSSSRMDTQWMQYFAYTIKGFGKLLEGEGNAYTTLKNGIKATSYLSGIPFYNAWRDVNATLNKLNVLTLEEQEEMFNDTIGEMFPSLRIK